VKSLDTAASRRSVENDSTSSSSPDTWSKSRIACHPIRVQLNVLAAAVAVALPVHGTVVPGASLGGVRLGDSQQRVGAVRGRKFAVCRGCARITWYYNYAAYEPQGAAVEFQAGRAVALYTLSSRSLWRAPQRRS